MKILGIVLLVLGLLGVLYGGVRYTSRDTVLDVGPIHATAERTHTLPVAPVVGFVLLGAGVVALIVARRKT